ncbi:MAG: 50S ribosomal protein L40e [Candidatus Aenigmarchaeota archaeon]|nr:50S ribosomal protein L40e [Candidatus Aenigmarchaeota archaeon]
MVKKTFPEAMNRIYNRVWVCRVCKAKMKADGVKVKAGAIKCRACGSRALRPKKRPA